MNTLTILLIAFISIHYIYNIIGCKYVTIESYDIKDHKLYVSVVPVFFNKDVHIVVIDLNTLDNLPNFEKLEENTINKKPIFITNFNFNSIFE